MPSIQTNHSVRIAVFGLGYVGSVTSACLARLGNRVIGVDKDENKVRHILNGQAPFYEPGLEELIRENVAAGRLTATASVAEAVAEADIALLCVGTPSARNGNLSLEQMHRVAEEIAGHLAGRENRLIVAVRSTVFPGTCETLAERHFAGHPCVRVVSNPEFLREGSAVRDFMEPSLVVIGGSDPEAVNLMASVYAPLGVEPCLVSLGTAEMIKYSCNAFHALKVAFANEMGALCDSLGVPGTEVMDTLCKDVKLNISPAYLKPGFAFGGSCLPKDLRALNYRALRLDLDVPLLNSVLPSNQSQLDRAIRDVLDLPAERLGLFGLAFKENTDDLRESPVVSLIEQLIGKGRNLRVFDPHIQIDEIYGSNRNFVLAAVPHIGKLLDKSIDGLLGWADHIVVTQKPSPEMASRILNSGLPVTDLVGALPVQMPAPVVR